MRFNKKYLYVKFTKEVTLSDPATGEVWYYSDKPTDSAVNTSVNMGEIRAGVSNPIVAIIPSDTNVTVDITSADFDLAMRAYQSGGRHGYGAPTLVCADVTASSATLAIPETAGTPVAGQGFDSAFAYVQEIGAASTVAGDGTPYSIGNGGSITGFTATSGKKYKIWFWIDKATTEYAALSSKFDPAIANCRLVQPVFANESGTPGKTDTQVGNLVTIIPYLKLGGNAGVTGSSSANSTTSVSGTAIAYDDAVVEEGCSGCGESGADLAYYLYVPCDDSGMIEGLVFVGGAITVPKSSTTQLQPYLVVGGSLVKPDAAFMSYSMTTSISGTTVSSAGVLSAGSTAGSGELTATYDDGSVELSCPLNVTVSA